jgi:UDP-galactopyranose mutase
MKKYDAIVIGTGIGGSALSALLAHYGLKVLIVEKNDRIGGSCSYYKKDGFHVDIGTHTFSRGNKGPLGAVQRKIGKPETIKFLQTRNLALARDTGLGLDLVMPSSPLRMPKFFVDLFRQLKIPVREIPNVVRLFYDIMKFNDDEIESWDDRTVEDFIGQYTKHPRVFAYFGMMLGLFFVLPLWETCSRT